MGKYCSVFAEIIAVHLAKSHHEQTLNNKITDIQSLPEFYISIIQRNLQGYY